LLWLERLQAVNSKPRYACSTPLYCSNSCVTIITLWGIAVARSAGMALLAPSSTSISRAIISLQRNPSVMKRGVGCRQIIQDNSVQWR
jgi:hypothetical protein